MECVQNVHNGIAHRELGIGIATLAHMLQRIETLLSIDYFEKIP